MLDDDSGTESISKGSEENIEIIKKLSSTGYLRKRLPKELISAPTEPKLFTSPQDNEFKKQDSKETLSETGTIISGEQSYYSDNKRQKKVDQRKIAKLQGYEGDPCSDCGNYTLVRNGTCMKCNTCGGTSGCS